MMNRCLYCYKELVESEVDYHKECAEVLFGGNYVDMPYSVEQLRDLSQREVQLVPLSIFESDSVERCEEQDDSLWSRFVVDPEEGVIASLTMKLAQAAHIVTAAHTLVRTTDGELRLAVRRVDIASGGERLPMEDGCQISELTPEERYEGAYEEVMEMIEEYSSVGRIDVITLWEQVVFAWICGYSDFNLQGVALYEPYSGICSLAPLRFATSNGVVDRERIGEMALSVNNKRKKIVRQDLEGAMRRSGLKSRAINIIFKKFVAARDQWFDIIEESLLSDDQKAKYRELLDGSLRTLAPKE